MNLLSKICIGLLVTLVILVFTVAKTHLSPQTLWVFQILTLLVAVVGASALIAWVTLRLALLNQTTDNPEPTVPEPLRPGSKCWRLVKTVDGTKVAVDHILAAVYAHPHNHAAKQHWPGKFMPRSGWNYLLSHTGWATASQVYDNENKASTALKQHVP